MRTVARIRSVARAKNPRFKPLLQMARKIDFVSQNSHDQNVTIFDQIDDVVFGMMVDAHWRIVFAAFSRNIRICRNNVDSLAETRLIPIGLISAEVFETVENSCR